MHYHCPRKQKVSTTDLKKSCLVFCIPFYSKTKHKPTKKIQWCDFLLNRRLHAKIQLIWMKKKNGPKFDIEWLCSDVFSWLLICTNSLSPHLRLHYPPPPNKKKSWLHVHLSFHRCKSRAYRCMFRILWYVPNSVVNSKYAKNMKMLDL